MNMKLTSPSKYFTFITEETECKNAHKKEVRKEAKFVCYTQRNDQNRSGMDKMKKQMGQLEEEIDSLNMPLVNEFKIILLKQRANAYRRTVQGQIQRNVNMEAILPLINKKI